jgi:hypothetical protein
MPRSRKPKPRRDAPIAPAPAVPAVRVGEIVARLLPRGSGIEEEEPIDWDVDRTPWAACPAWPPDLFAVAATLVKRSDAYSAFVQSPWSGTLFTPTYREEVVRLGASWRTDLAPPGAVQQMWEELVDAFAEPLGPLHTVEGARVPLGPHHWARLALRLMAVADEASIGVGFTYAQVSAFAELVMAESHATLKKTKETERALQQIPSSLCWRVPQEECCVLPKTRTPQVGITLAALSHHLALLPSVSEVWPRWLMNPVNRSLPRRGSLAFNLLLVPFPYQVEAPCFSEREPATDGAQFFQVSQRWLRDPVSPRRLAGFVDGLVAEAERDGAVVDGVILPELSLDPPCFQALERTLARRPEVQFLIGGVLQPGTGDAPVNQVRCAVFSGGRRLLPITQSKHHRWRLDARQIARYGLAHVLGMGCDWWEDVDVTRRSCSFFQISSGACVAAVVCEDLARVEPVHTVLRAVGPNLVVALLMDGPQLGSRWSSRYATVLAEDPGSSVLTLTCLGMVRRSQQPGEDERREIALWKDAGSTVRELSLPPGCHALRVSLALDWEETFALDGRSDHGFSVKVQLAAVQGIAVPAPDWLGG